MLSNWRVVYVICDCRVVYAIVIVVPFMWFVIVGVYAVCDCRVIYYVYDCRVVCVVSDCMVIYGVC